jgi:4-amino-4-deoxy-L-arabinose transferase-like glycosyltransferase
MSDTTGGPSHPLRAHAVPVVFAAAAFLLLLLPGLLGPYGPFIDELYYVSCAERLDWGYVDHPPLAPALLRVARTVLGDGLMALRLPVAALGALLMLGAGGFAGRLGAGRFGQALACGALLTAPLFQIMFGFFSMNGLEILLWAALLWTLIEIERRDAPRLWLLFGALAGVALMTKHTVIVLVMGLGVGLVATPARRHLKDGRFWLGALLAALIVAPNLAWQAAHGWPSIEFYRNAALLKQTRLPALQVLVTQVVFVSPGTLPLWLAGLVALWRRDLRHVAIAYVALLAFMAAGHESRPDRIAGVYPVLFAAGGAWWERRLRGARAWLPGALVAWLVAWGAILAPLGLPILAPGATARWAATLGVVPQFERGAGKRNDLPQWFADRFGWEQLVQDVASVRARLTPDEQSRVVYFAPSYGQAGALEWLGRDRGLTPVYSTHNSFYFWGPPADPVEVAIVIGNRRERLEKLFGEVTLGVVHDCEFCMPWRDGMPIWIGRRPLVRIADRWPEWKHFE